MEQMEVTPALEALIQEWMSKTGKTYEDVKTNLDMCWSEMTFSYGPPTTVDGKPINQ